MVWLAAILTAGCATAPVQFRAVEIESNKPALKTHALQILKTYNTSGGEDAAALAIRESVEENYESVDASGKVNRYKINYTLFYRFGAQGTQNLSYEIVVNHDENNFLASRAKRAQALHELREGALRQMFFLINRES